MARLPKLPALTAYLHLDNAARRNALSLDVLRSLRTQLHEHLRSPATGQILALPPFRSSLLRDIQDQPQHRWLVDAAEWRRLRAGLPNVLVLKSEGAIFSSGHDLKELASMSYEDRKATFATCAEVLSLIRRSPAVVICPVQGLATAAGFQLALSCDIPVARGETKFQLPGMAIGLPCTSPSTVVSRRLPPGLAYRLFATAESIAASQLGGAVSVVDGEADFDSHVNDLVAKLAALPGQPQAMGKWAYWTQLSIRGEGLEGDGDGYEEAAQCLASD